MPSLVEVASTSGEEGNGSVMRSSSKKLSKFGISMEMVNNGLHMVR